MSGVIWSKFFWSDWESDQTLRACSAAAQGLWMRMLCICAASDPPGYLVLNSRALGAMDLAAITGWPSTDVETWLDELGRWGVFSIDRKGRIFSRRMVLDAKRAKNARKNGSKGGNPKLCNHSPSGPRDNPSDNPPDKPHKPRARSQKPSNITPNPQGGGSKSAFSQSFDRAFAAYPETGRATTTPDMAREAWAEAARDTDPEALVSAVRAFAVSPFATADGGKRVPSFQKWLRQGRYSVWTGGASRSDFAGPPDFRAAVIATKDEAWTRAYVDPCGWREGVLLPRTTTALEKLQREIPEILREHGLTVVWERVA